MDRSRVCCSLITGVRWNGGVFGAVPVRVPEGPATDVPYFSRGKSIVGQRVYIRSRLVRKRSKPSLFNTIRLADKELPRFNAITPACMLQNGKLVGHTKCRSLVPTLTSTFRFRSVYLNRKIIVPFFLFLFSFPLYRIITINDSKTTMILTILILGSTRVSCRLFSCLVQRDGKKEPRLQRTRLYETYPYTNVLAGGHVFEKSTRIYT